MRYAVALSGHPDASTAIGEVVGQILDRLGFGPDLAVLFMTGHHVESVRQSGSAIRSTLGVRTLVGATAVSVLAHRQEVEEAPAVALWAGHTGPCRSLRLESQTTQISDLEASGAVVVLADPFSYDPSALLSSAPSGLDVVGGLASSASRPGGNRLLLDDSTYEDGAVAVALPAGSQSTLLSRARSRRN